MAARVPRIEVTDHSDTHGVGRPYREADAGHALEGQGVGAQHLGHLEMPALVEQVQVEIAQQRAEGVGVLGLLHRAGPLDAQQVGRAIDDGALEQALGSGRLELADQLAVAAAQDLDGARAGQEGADDTAGRGVARAQELERIAVAGMRQRLGFRRRKGRDRARHQPGLRVSSPRMRPISRCRPCSGMVSQAGRLAAS
jgi:hypothetical protein